MFLADFQVSEPVLPEESVKIKVNPVAGEGELPNIMMCAYSPRAIREDGLFGECYSFSLGHLQRSERAQDQLYINWLGVHKKFQNRGWGRYLLIRTLWEAQKIGYKHSLLSTGEKNHRALLFYTNYGYRVLHSSYTFVKSLSE